jgi:uncharacterized protein (TIGR02271 family)
MGIFSEIFGNDEEIKNEMKNETSNEDVMLRLRKEELDINKSRVQTGDVEFSKEIIEEQKIVDVPVRREEVVIERRTLNNEQSDSPITDEESIRIPVSEEVVDVDKRTVITGEISAHKREIEDIRHIDETLRREEARVNKTGNPDVVDSEQNSMH